MSKWMRTPERMRPHKYAPAADSRAKPEYKPCGVCRRMEHYRLHQSWWWRMRNKGKQYMGLEGRSEDHLTLSSRMIGIDMDNIVRSTIQIDTVRNWAAEGRDQGSHFPGMSYEDGIEDFAAWLFGDTDENPTDVML